MIHAPLVYETCRSNVDDLGIVIVEWIQCNILNILLKKTKTFCVNLRTVTAFSILILQMFFIYYSEVMAG